MTLGAGDIGNLVDGLQLFKVLFVPTVVDLHGGGQVTVGCYVVRRRMAGSDLTGGMVQYETLALFDKKEWDTTSPGRTPKKNDVVNHQGRRLALEEVVPHAPADQDFMYRCRIKG